jgi:hypothetical protein
MSHVNAQYVHTKAFEITYTTTNKKSAASASRDAHILRAGL